jgi:uncharacterized protein YndB with AHSA1/START domain
MWKRIVVDAQLDHPVEQVFAYLADPMRWHDFAPAVVMRRPISEGPLRTGSRWAATDRVILPTIHFVDELVEYEPNRRLVWSSSAPWNALTTYACEPFEGGTRVRATYEGAVSGWLRLVSYVPDVILWWVLSGDFRRLRRRLARDARATRRVGAPAGG